MSDGIQIRQCGICEWKQTTGNGEDVLACPECGSMSWVPAEEVEAEEVAL